jgi:50S ribosomal subunit-associated GTPase HflX
MTGEGLDELKRRMIEVLERGDEEIELNIPAAESGKRLAELATHGRVLAQEWTTRDSGASHVRVRARLHPRWFKALHIRKTDIVANGSAASESTLNESALQEAQTASVAA